MLIMKLNIRKNSVKRYIGRPDLKMCIYWFFFQMQINDDDIIDEYLTLKNLNLKRKYIRLPILINMYICIIYVLLLYTEKSFFI